MKRKLNKYDIFVRFNEAIHIIDKVRFKGEETFVNFVSSRNPFGLSSSTRGNQTKTEGDYLLITSGGNFYINKKNVMQGDDLINKYKILISKVTCEHAGEPDKEGMFRVISRMEVLPPNSVSTDSYLIIGEHTDKEFVKNECNYLKTKFARFLLLQAISSINLSKDKFQFVPLQDFSKPWTDEELYKKYGLTEDEIAFIESMIRPME
jgi:site-specific DNA-methyltransferase (adenine-specific)